MNLCIQFMVTGHYPSRVPPFGYLRITAYLQLPEAFRSLSRPSSAISAMASTLRSYSLDLAILSHRAPKTIETQFLRFVTFVTIFHCEFVKVILPNFNLSKLVALRLWLLGSNQTSFDSSCAVFKVR